MIDPDTYKAARLQLQKLAETDPHVKTILQVLDDYESSLTWHTTCLGCSELLDKLYEAEQVISRYREGGA